MDAADDVDLIELVELGLGGVGVDCVQVHLPRPFGAVLPVEAAEVAVEDADVRVVEVHVPDVVGDVAVLFLADVVGEPPEGEEVVAPEEPDAVLEGQPLAGLDLLFDILEVIGHPGLGF
jgi:hypothetical protein